MVDLPPIPQLKVYENEVEEVTVIKILTPKKLITELPVLLAQVKAINNSCKLKNEIRQILYLLHMHNKISKAIFTS